MKMIKKLINCIHVFKGRIPSTFFTGRSAKYALVLAAVTFLRTGTYAQTTPSLPVPEKSGINFHNNAILLEVDANHYNGVNGYNGSRYLGGLHFFDEAHRDKFRPAAAGAVNIDAEKTITLGRRQDPMLTVNLHDKKAFWAGSVGIGTAVTGSHTLAVEGSVGARSVKVEVSGWSDFVFERDYALPALEEVEAYIAVHKHLPAIPGEAEVIEQGVDLGEMDARLLQKIEELTLYLIGQHKQLQRQQAHVSRLEEKIDRLTGKKR